MTTMNARHLVLFLVQCVLWPSVAPLADDPRLWPETIQDEAGNSADADSNITWSGLPRGDAYNSPVAYDAGALEPYYDIVNGFISTVQPNDFPYDLVEDLLTNNFDISQDYMEVVNYGLGIGICAALGLLFMIIFPIVACCFCCCRVCCKKCGGKMMQKSSKNHRCKKITFSVCLLACTALMAVGAACMYATNDVLTDSVSDIGSSVTNSFGDISVYVKNMVNEIDHVALVGFNFTSEVLSRDLHNLGYLLGIPARRELEEVIKLDETLSSFEQFESVISTVSADLINVNSSLEDLKLKGLILQANLSSLADKVEQAKNDSGCDNCTDTGVLKMDANFTRLPDISEEMNLLESALSQNLSGNIQEGKKEFDNIPWTVQNETASMTEGITETMYDVYTNIDSGLDSLMGIQDQVSDFIDPITETVDSYVNDYVNPYDIFRWYACIGMASLVILVVLMQLLGLTCGLTGTCTARKPTERTRLADTGGNCLMAASGFIFLFAALLTLLLLIFFLLGLNMETLFCRTLTDPEYKVFELLEGDNGLLISNGYLMSSVLFQNSSIKLPLSSVFKACDANKPAMQALELYRKFDLNDMLNWRQYVNITSEIEELDIDLSDVNIITNDTKVQLNDFKEAVQIDYQGFVDELSKNTTKVDLAEYEANLRTLNESFPDAGFGEAADALAAIRASGGIYEQVREGQIELLSNVVALNQSTQSIPESIDNLLAKATVTQEALQQNATDVVKKVAKDFQKRAEGVIDSFVQYANNSIYNDIGKCRPVSNIYKASVDVAMCQSIISTFNGFWFGLGMAVFFMIPSLIFNVKLAKYFRRMKYTEEMDDVNVDPPTDYLVSNGKHPLIPRAAQGLRWSSNIYSTGQNHVYPDLLIVQQMYPSDYAVQEVMGGYT